MSMCKLKTLIKFMKVLLSMILFKSVVIIFEAIFLLVTHEEDDISSLNLYVTGICEFLNWTTTQIIIWLVALRFYESSIPVRKLHI